MLTCQLKYLIKISASSMSNTHNLKSLNSYHIAIYVDSRDIMTLSYRV